MMHIALVRTIEMVRGMQQTVASTIRSRVCDTDLRRTKCQPFSSGIHKTYKPRIPLGKAWELEWVSVKPNALVHLDFPSYCSFFLNALFDNAFVLGKLDVMSISACELQEEKVN